MLSSTCRLAVAFSAMRLLVSQRRGGAPRLILAPHAVSVDPGPRRRGVAGRGDRADEPVAGDRGRRRSGGGVFSSDPGAYVAGAGSPERSAGALAGSRTEEPRAVGSAIRRDVYTAEAAALIIAGLVLVLVEDRLGRRQARAI